jgi:transposase
LRVENARLQAEVERLRGQVEELRRAGKRQAAPFSKGKPKPNPGRSGRRSGNDHGRHGHREVPDHVDEEIRVPLPDACPACGGELEFEREADQYQEDLLVPVRPHVRRFRVATGRCRCCRRRTQGRHSLQTSDALGAAGAQVGPNALALAAQLNKELGLSASKVARVLAQLCGIAITAGGLYQALARVARAATATYGALVLAVRHSPAVAADETGWRVDGRRQWLWVFVGERVTVYLVAAGRGYGQATVVLGEDYDGVLERDGWAPYRRFVHARHQTCLAHLLRRCGEMIADSHGGQARIPHAVRKLLLDMLALRDQHAETLRRRDDDEVIDGHAVEIDPPQLPAPESPSQGLLARVAGLARRALPAGDRAPTTEEIPAIEPLVAGRAELQARLEKLLAVSPTHAPNRKLLAHLANERQHLLTFLQTQGVQATNWRAEQAIRPAVVNRKNWGGNRTWRGADTQQVLMSVIRTARQQGTDPVALLSDLQHHQQPTISPALTFPQPPDHRDSHHDTPAPARGP